jgi:hypothetical protein
MRVSLGFVPAWFHQQCGVDFSETWHKDPRYRYDTLVKMKEGLKVRASSYNAHGLVRRWSSADW